ncbi:DNA-3-methyladenine glycosylase I [Candidatus Margulisiibacteriota bacterium]
MKLPKYKEIFMATEGTLKKYSSFSDSKFKNNFGKFKTFEKRTLSDDDYYDITLTVVFASGFKAGTVSKKKAVIKNHFPNYKIVSTYGNKEVSRIMKDTDMIKNRKKIVACINNAKRFKEIISQYGSFNNYVASFKPKESFENLMLFKEEIEYKFDYLGGITAYHFMTDIGLSVLKPDRVIARIFKRLGLIENPKQKLKTVIQGLKFSEATQLPIRYIDIIFVKYGQSGKEKNFGLEDGICLEVNPKCSICGIKKFCTEYKKF